jgi:AraC family transcriptional regulator of arabinose operon
MVNYLNDFRQEILPPVAGVLLADHFIKPHGFSGHRSNGTKDWLMIFTVSGEGHFRAFKQVQICLAGDIVILPPGIPHHYATPQNCVWELMWAHFVPLPEWQSWLQLPRTEENLIYLSIEDKMIHSRIKDAFGRLIHDNQQLDKSYQQLAQIALSEILALLHQLQLKHRDIIIDERMDAILKHLAGHLEKPHTIPDLAKFADLSVSRLCHLFKEQVGETIGEKLNKMRLEKASRILELTSHKIQDIALEVGFESPYYFTRKFTQLFGSSPTDFRKNAQSKWIYNDKDPK